MPVITQADDALPMAGWEKLLNTPAGLTGTTTNDEEVYALQEHKGLLYIGYYTAGLPNAKRAARLYTWDGQTQTLKYTFGVGLHFASLQALGEYKGNLYAALSGLYAGNGDIYVSSDGGTTWAKSYDTTTDYFCSTLVAFKDKLYAGMGYKISRIMVFDGTTWKQSYPGKGSGLIEWMTVYRGRLYAAIGGPSQGKAAIVSTADGITWTVDYDNAGAPTLYSETAFLTEFRGRLYAGMLSRTTTAGGDLLVRDDSTGTWNLAWSNPNGTRIHSMGVYNDRLYLGNAGAAGAGDVYVTDDGINFKKDLDTPLREVFRLYPYRDSLYMGSGYKSAEAQIWRKTDQVALRIRLRKIWEGQAALTRSYIVSYFSGLLENTAVKNKLIKNQQDLADIIKPYYGDAAKSQLTTLLDDHLTIALKVLQATEGQDTLTINAVKAEWKANADQIALFLGGLNDHWIYEEIRDLLCKHLEFASAQMAARVSQDWETDLNSFNLDREKVLTLSDVLTDGIVNQFPDKFQK